MRKKLINEIMRNVLLRNTKQKRAIAKSADEVVVATKTLSFASLLHSEHRQILRFPIHQTVGTPD